MSEPVRPGRLWATEDPGEPWLTPSRLAALVAVAVAAYATIIVVRALRELLVMLLVALFLSFAMEPAVQFLSRRGWRRGVATGAVFAVAFVAAGFIVYTLAGFVVDQAVRLAQGIPTTLGEVNRLLDWLPFDIDLEATPELEREALAFTEDLGERLREVALGAAGNVVAIGATALGLLARMLAVLLVTFYIVADGPRLRRAIARPLPPTRQREMLAMWELAVAKTGGYIYSRLLIGAASAVVHWLALLVLGVPNALALAIWMGLLTALIPLVGVPLGGTLLIVAAFIHEPRTALWLLVIVLAYQQIENYVLGPKVQARVMDLHPAVAFLSVIVGAMLLGLVGALLALPAAAITKALLSTYVARHDLIEELHEVEIGVELDDETEQEPEPEETKA